MKRHGKDLKWQEVWGKCAQPPHKRRWPERHKAKRVARHTGGSAYQCPHCGDWHLTHYPPRVQRAITYLINSLKGEKEPLCPRK